MMGFYINLLDGKRFSFLYDLTMLENLRAFHLCVTQDGHLIAIRYGAIYRAKDETYQEWDIINLPVLPEGDEYIFDYDYPYQY